MEGIAQQRDVMQIVLGNEAYTLKEGTTQAGNLSLRLLDINGESVAELSVDVRGVSRQPDEIILKMYGENQKIPAQMVTAKILNPTPHHVLVGGFFCPICKIPDWKDRPGSIRGVELEGSCDAGATLRVVAQEQVARAHLDPHRRVGRIEAAVVLVIFLGILVMFEAKVTMGQGGQDARAPGSEIPVIHHGVLLARHAPSGD